MATEINGPHPPRKKRILIICDYYLPSMKGGGGTWTVVNLIERFCDRYDFFVGTRNHESRTDTRPFPSVKSDAWNDIGNARVYYLTPDRITPGTLAKLIRQISPDGVFLNSVFSKPVVTFLRLRRTRRSIEVPVILAPCGELSEGALGLKRQKKWVFLTFAKAFGLYSNINWKATTALEREEIRRVFGQKLVPWIAPDLPPREILPGLSTADKPCKKPGKAKFIYYSRIAPIKNLSFVLESFSKAVSSQRVEFLIAGPIDDESYWQECEEKLTHLSSSVSVNVIGPVSHEEGLDLLTKNHFFILPTLGENFGYVILEALAAGCPVIISDRTIWTAVQERKAGWTISLYNGKKWNKTIGQCIGMNQTEYSSMSKNARQIAVDWLKSPDMELATEKILAEVIGV
jgi:glycosyltransferase involved in cell wall biosynthesis